MDNNVSKNTFSDKFSKLHLKIDCVAIKKLLEQQIFLAINSVESQENIHLISKSLTTTINDKIILHRSSQASLTVIYRCAIGFLLARQWQLSPLITAKKIINLLNSCEILSPSQTTIEFTLNLIPPGWIDFSLQPSSLAIWLQELVLVVEKGEQIEPWQLEANKCKKVASSATHQTVLFPIQYVHSRCCSLLRLGQREGLIELKETNFTNFTWQIAQKHQILGLNTLGELLFKHPSEFALILQLINTVDLLVHGQPTNWVKQAESLSRAIVNFEADCRIFGELSRKRPEISRLRLILVALAQYFLNRILQEKLSIIPLTEL